jgi:uncharacterized protein
LIIDAHTHLLDTAHWPREWWDWVAADWAQQKPGRHAADVRDRIEPGLIDPDGSRMVARMDQAGVDASVVLPIDWGPDFSGTRPITDVVDQALEQAHAHPGRLLPFAGIDPRREGAVELVRNWFDRGARGLKLYPGCGWEPRSPAAMDIYQVCQERRAPVLFHTGDPLPVLDAERSNPLLLKEVATNFPDLPLWLGHAGAPVWWEEALQVAEAGPKVRLEMSVWVWDDSDEAAEVALAQKVLEAGERVGFDRILFGTDHVSGRKVRDDAFLSTVVGMFQRLPQHAEKLGGVITETELETIMGGAAAADLGVRPVTLRDLPQAK